MRRLDVYREAYEGIALRNHRSTTIRTRLEFTRRGNWKEERGGAARTASFRFLSFRVSAESRSRWRPNAFIRVPSLDLHLLHLLHAISPATLFFDDARTEWNCHLVFQVDITELCPSATVLAQQLTHVELERLSYIGPEEFVQAFAKVRATAYTISSRPFDSAFFFCSWKMAASWKIIHETYTCSFFHGGWKLKEIVFVSISCYLGILFDYLTIKMKCIVIFLNIRLVKK